MAYIEFAWPKISTFRSGDFQNRGGDDDADLKLAIELRFDGFDWGQK